VNAAEPGGGSCRDVLDAVSAFLDGEMREDDCARMREHFQDCGHCLTEVDAYREIKALVARSCGCDPVPDEVRARVVSRLRSVTVQWQIEVREI